MQQALSTVTGDIDYINAHGTSTPAGDMQELKAVKAVFADGSIPVVGSTKSLSGHSLGAAGVQETIYSLLMMQEDFIAASANIEELDPEAEGMPIALQRVDEADLQRIMSNSFGFGGTNASLVFQRLS
jgi:3-oxoacyl-[acyl-carrier-protein] synthase-1